MMRRKFLPLLCILVMVAATGAAQGTKTIKEKKIASRTVNEYFIEEGQDEPVVESIERYNQEGALVEVKEMNRKGEIKKWEKYLYDKEGNLVEEQFLDVKGRVTQTEKNLYKDGLRIEKQFYNSRDQLYKKKVYVYEFHE
jgi:hypothetical protein